MRVYTDTNPDPLFCQTLCKNPNFFWCDIRNTPGLGDLSAMHFMTWRFLPLGDVTVDIFLSRDLDSVISSREAAAVHDWLELPERKGIHLMRDKLKSHRLEMLGGMWGARNTILGTVDSKRLQGNIIRIAEMLPKIKGLDQSIIVKEIYYPRFKDIVAYDSYYCREFTQTLTKGFPTQRENVSVDGATSDFVGNSGMGKDIYVLSKCPVECRPEHGKDWEYC